MSDGDDLSAAQRPSISEELSHERARRHARRAGLYVHALLVVALLVVIVALLLANRRTVKVSWVVGSSRQPVVWIVLVSAILGWLLGIFTSVFVPAPDAGSNWPIIEVWTERTGEQWATAGWDQIAGETNPVSIATSRRRKPAATLARNWLVSLVLYSPKRSKSPARTRSRRPVR